jgi:sugar lactone lactonase YvrE
LVLDVARDRLFVSNWKGHDVSELELSSGKLVRRIPTVRTPRGMLLWGDGLFVVGFGDGRIERIDLATGEGSEVFTGGSALRHIVADPAKKLAYVSDMGRRVIWRMSLEGSLTVTEFAKTDANPNTLAISPDGGLLFVSNRGKNGEAGYLTSGPQYGSVLVIDTATGDVVDSIVGGDQTTGLDVSADGSLIAFTDFRDDAMRLYRVPERSVLVEAGWPRREVHRRSLWRPVPAPQSP